MVADGVLQVSGDSGWLLTRRRYDDFVLAFAARQVGPNSVGGMLARALRLPKHRLAYEVQVAHGPKPSAVLLERLDRDFVPALTTPPTVMPSDGEWHRYRIESVGDGITVRRDGQPLLSARGAPLTTGHIALASRVRSSKELPRPGW